MKKFVKDNELKLIILIILTFLVLNVFTSSRSPIVWVDEVSYADPAVNFVLNGNFTSTSHWYTQELNSMWAGNVPLHQFILVGWLEVFGVDPTSVRSLNYVFILIGVILLWLVLKRKDLSSPALRLATVVLLLCGRGITLSHRSGRPDMIGFLLVSIGIFSFLLPKKRRQTLLACVGVLVPWAGLQFVPYVALVCGCILFWNRKLFLETSLAVAGGGIAGTAGLVLFYKSNGVWEEFIQSVSPHIDGAPVNTLSGIDIYLWDESYLILLISGIFLFIHNIYKSKSLTATHPILRYGISVGVITPALLYILGKYPRYYTWMAYLPLVIGVCVQASSIRWNQWKSWLAVGLVGAASLWLPARMGVSIVQWDARSYERVESLARRTISEADTVYASHRAYYGAKRNASVVYLPGSLQHIHQDIQLRSINKVIADPRQADKFFSKLGGEWKRLAQIGENAKQQEIFGRKLEEPYRLATFVRLRSEK